MKWTGLNELREKFLSFFEGKGHLRLKSFPLIPIDDPSLLLINSGMAPMKPYFQGKKEPPSKRVTTCQKCIRTPDLEHVGKTDRHGTYFEMLGNFSFGDYFKKEALDWAWEFLTETLAIDPEYLWISVYEQDREAYEIWTKQVGVPEKRVVRLGKEDNFWEHGVGPCGPCSEIYFDRGAKYGCASPHCKPGCDCDRYMEVWNNVFTQFDGDGNGNYTELAQKNIDTGMGLERLACMMQGVNTLFEVDTIRRVLDTVCSYAGVSYRKNPEQDVSIRIITDHIRSISVMICDGVIPSNEGRGYVLRRLLRRAARHGRLLGIKGAFLNKLCEVVITENEGAYPELREKAGYIAKVIGIEEERFDATIDSGLTILSGMIADLRQNGETTLSGEDSFKLYDTFGFPIDLTKEILEEKGLSADEEAFHALMTEQKTRARENRKAGGGWSQDSADLLAGLPETEFLGYTDASNTAAVIALIAGEMFRDTVSEGEVTVILDRTVFYAESGGQVGDTGVIRSENAELLVSDTKKTDGVVLHICEVKSGALSVGDTVTAAFDAERRNAIRRNHSSAHLLQAALKKVLGEHVEQAGSYVDGERLRFDFSHFQAMTKQQLREVEEFVNRAMLAGAPVETIVTDMETAKKMGAAALFGEKYGDVVRVIKMGDFSAELCGGTHLTNTAMAGLFKIISESSVAAGIRRIEAVTGENVLAYIYHHLALLSDTAKALKTTNIADLSRKAEQTAIEMKSLHSRIEKQNAQLVKAKTAALAEAAKPVGRFRLVSALMEDMTAQDLRIAADLLRQENDDIVVLLASKNNDGGVSFAASCGEGAMKNGANAGKIVKQAAVIAGGGGGGRPDSASAGGKDAAKIDLALQSAEEILRR